MGQALKERGCLTYSEHIAGCLSLIVCGLEVGRWAFTGKFLCCGEQARLVKVATRTISHIIDIRVLRTDNISTAKRTMKAKKRKRDSIGGS